MLLLLYENERDFLSNLEDRNDSDVYITYISNSCIYICVCLCTYTSLFLIIIIKKRTENVVSNLINFKYIFIKDLNQNWMYSRANNKHVCSSELQVEYVRDGRSETLRKASRENSL